MRYLNGREGVITENITLSHTEYLCNFPTHTRLKNGLQRTVCRSNGSCFAYTARIRTAFSRANFARLTLHSLHYHCIKSMFKAGISMDYSSRPFRRRNQRILDSLAILLRITGLNELKVSRYVATLTFCTPCSILPRVTE